MNNKRLGLCMLSATTLLAMLFVGGAIVTFLGWLIFSYLTPIAGVITCAVIVVLAACTAAMYHDKSFIPEHPIK